MRTPALRGGPAGAGQPGGVAGVEPARDVGAGDQVEHGVVVAESPHPEALTEIGVEVDGHVDTSAAYDGQRSAPGQPFSETNSASGRPSVHSSISSTGRSGNSGTGPRHRIATGSASSGMPSSAAQPDRIEDRHPAEAEAFGAGGQPQVLDGARHRGQVHLRQGAAAEDVPVAVVAECDDEEFGAFEDALDLQRQELVAARAQRSRGAAALVVDQGVDLVGAARRR